MTYKWIDDPLDEAVYTNSNRDEEKEEESKDKERRGRGSKKKSYSRIPFYTHVTRALTNRKKKNDSLLCCIRI